MAPYVVVMVGMWPFECSTQEEAMAKAHELAERKVGNIAAVYENLSEVLVKSSITLETEVTDTKVARAKGSLDATK